MLRVGQLSHSTMLLQNVDTDLGFVLCQMLYGAQQLRVFLAHDLVELRGPHPGLLQLLEGFAGFDALMLPCVTDE